jgi:hypothetical protein
MNELISLYRQRFKILDEHLKKYNLNALPDRKATNPFLITIPDDYDSYKNRIMIFGQETNGWCNQCGNNREYSNSIDKSIEIYREFYLEGGIDSYSGPFWNEFKRIRNEIVNEKNALFLWNNVNKIGRIGKGNIREINEIQFNYFQIIKEEIRLFKPNIMIFLTGPDYDLFIKRNIGEFNQKEISDSIWEISFKDDIFKSIKSIKTYHPNALYFQSKNGTVIPNLINEITKACI